MTRCYFVSDLHLFASRSRAAQYHDAIVEAASAAEAFVLGGDIFDFRWATRHAAGQAVDDAAAWLGALAADCPGCHFHFLLGNHDYHRPFIDRLIRLEREIENLSWHRYYFRRGRSVFLHGDVADRRSDAAMLAAARSRWLHRRTRGPVLDRLYDAVVSAGLHRPIPYVVYRRRTVARRIYAYLENIGQGPEDGVRNVYFGHTHRAMSNYHYHGLLFHNGGAPIKGTRFAILEAEL
jgi:UDP-2,3-diacylglucosamine pyrophosphatase LpxH